jgi:DNA repair photolyase
VLRLPHAVKEVFLTWLDVHAPTKKARVVDRIRALRGGKLYDATFGARMRGQGIFAEQIRQVFAVASRRAGLETRHFELSSAAFRRPASDDLHRGDGTQLELL